MLSNVNREVTKTDIAHRFKNFDIKSIVLTYKVQ